jgi:hypothetical protein
MAKDLVTAAGNGKLAGDRGKDGLYLSAEPEQNRNCDNGNKGENQRILNESLTFLVLLGR